MQTLRQIVSDIRGDEKLLSSDLLISDRLIASQVRDTANKLLTQQTDKRKFWNSPNVFTPILCLEMEEVPLTECCEYTGTKMVAKSKLALPRIGEGLWGLAIQLVTGLDNSKVFKETSPRRYSNLLKLNLTTNDNYYWILNNHLYVSNPDTLKVNMYAYFTEDVPNNLLVPNAGCKCTAPLPITLCTNPLDKPFWFPANYISDLKTIVLDRFSRTFLNRKQDVTSDNKEND